MFVGDMMTEEGTTMTLESMKSTFNVNVNILHYFRIRKLIKSSTRDFKDANPSKLQHPNCPFHLKILLKQNRGCREFYNIFLNSKQQTLPLCEIFWTFLVETENKPVFWNNIYKSTFKCVRDNAVISMQYKILFNIIPTKEYLFKSQNFQ